MSWASLAFAQDSRDVQRIALLIGNSDYKSAPLANPVNDARAMAGALAGLGFETIVRENVKTRELGSVYREFRSRIKPGAVALVFYAGHGVQVRGQNYFPSVDSEISAEEDVPLQSLNLSTLLENMEEARAGLSVVLLDACRNNPYVRGFRSAAQGLSKVTAPSGTLIHYATKPGSVADDGRGKNSPYTQALLAHLGTPGIQIEIALKNVTNAVVSATQGKQEPWVEGSLRGDFYLRPAQNQTTGTVADATANDRAFWETVRDSRKSAELVAYLDRFPNGLFAVIARSRLSELQSPGAASNPSSSPQTPVAVPNLPPIDPNEAYKRGLEYANSASSLWNDGEAVRLFRIASDQGHSEAQAELGAMYMFGRGVLAKDDSEAVRLYKFSAEAGNGKGQAGLGLMYRNGRGGLKRDDAEALRLYRLSANQGNSFGQLQLGVMYQNGWGGLNKDDVEAVRLFRLSASQGNPFGQSSLGFMYRNGRGGLKRDDAEALRLHRLSANQGNAFGQSQLGWMYQNGFGGVSKDEVEAVRLYRLSASQGHPTGQSNLGWMYLRGLGGLAQDDVEAVRLFKLAAEQGGSLGQANLARMYQHGRGGLPKDEVEAIRLYRLAAESGTPWAITELKKLGKL
jgi:TPR repeat protein